MRKRPLCFLCLFFLIIQSILLILKSGQSLFEIPASSIFSEGKEKTVFIQGQVYKKTSTSKIQILYLKNNSVYDSKLMIYDDNFIEIPIGKTVYLKGTLDFFETARNPGNFDQALFYARQEIYGVIWCDEILKVCGETDWFTENLYQFKTRWKEMLIDVIGEENGAVLAAMLLGEKSEMDLEVKELYQKNGIGHVLAISGLHISFIGLGIYQLIRKTGLPYLISGVIAISVLGLYVCMIGFSVSVIRAFVMLLLRIGADMSGRVYDMLTALALAAAITIAYQPLYLTDGGFFMSYGAILGILLVLPTMEKCFGRKWKWLSGCYTSLAINVMLFPILLWYYYEFSTYSLVLNMLVIPLMSAVLGLGMLGSFCMLWFQPAGLIGLKLCDLILRFFETLSRVGNKLPMARIVLGQPDLWKVMIYYIVLSVLCIGIYKCKKDERLRKWRKFACLILGVLVMILAYRPNGSLTVTMLDVGQGDGIFIKGPKGVTYLIDGGSSDVNELGKYRIEPFLKSQGVGEVDYVFITHGDTDHYIGIEEMLGRQSLGVRINNLVLPANFRQDEALLELAKIAQGVGTNVVVIKEGEYLTEGNLQIACIQPSKNDAELSGNAGSMVLEVNYREFSMLCTGDVEAEGEDLLIKRIRGKDYDVLKVAHHGSKNSTSEEFLNMVRPEIALISSGVKNSYGHPHKETLKRLENAGCQIYFTMEKGAITLITDGNSLTISSLPFRL